MQTHPASLAQFTVLRYGTLIDGDGGPPHGDAALLVEGERIRAITAASDEFPAGARVLDLRGKTIMPPIVNCHCHLGLLKGTGSAWANFTEANVDKQLLQYQDYGVGAVMSMGTDQPSIWKWREESRAGARSGATIFTAGSGFGVPAGLPPAAAGHEPVFRPSTPDQARAHVRELAPHHPDLVKMWVDDFWGQYPKMEPEISAAIIDEAHNHGLRVAAHIYHLADAQRLADDGIDAFAHSVRDAIIPDALIEKMKRNAIAQITTLSLDDFLIAYAGSPAWLHDPYFRNAAEPGLIDLVTSAHYRESVRKDPKTPIEQRALPIAKENTKKLFDAGVLVALGTDSGANSLRVVGFGEHRELQLLVEAGLTPLQAITIATRNGAELLHASDEFGTLRPGLLANFVVLDRDPSADISNTESIAAVWHRGKEVSRGPHPRQD